MGLLCCAAVPAVGQTKAPGMLAADSPYNRSVDEIRRASVSWERRPGPRRQVVDLVCLVPDVPTFLEAIAVWDENHAFPILIDDVELTLKFLRAFRPARIVRYPRKVGPITAERLWDAARAAAGRAWVDETAGGAKPLLPPGDAVPRRLGPTPPGVVVSSPTSAMLAGGVALAAGRFQPLVRWEVSHRFADRITRDQAQELALDLEAQVADRVADYSKLGDDCDFLTLAGDWPYRYQDKDGPGAFDDLVARSAVGGWRWAFTGRLLGDATSSVYRAMCSLFLEPDATLLLNTYTGSGQPWSDYALTHAAQRLAGFAPVTLREGKNASLSDWLGLFRPMNRFGLVVINTHGTPTEFNLPGGPGHTADTPLSVPAAVLMIHSFSAIDPTDTETIAGRWLANGAFVYFGALYEPYIQSFRPPVVAAGLIREGLPLGAALRRSPPEPFGEPWRLVYLGDPLYQVQARAQRRPRLDGWERVAAWPAYAEFARPAAGASAGDTFHWALKTAIFQLQRSGRPQQPINLVADLLAIDRDQLNVPLRPVYDALLVDTLLQANRPDLLLEQLARIPPAGRSAVVERASEALQMARLQTLVAARDFPQLRAFWAKVVQTEPSPVFLQVFTDRVAALADSPARRAAWRTQLQEARRGLDDQSSLRSIIGAALKRVEQQIADQL
jgi:hypothetical protein